MFWKWNWPFRILGACVLGLIGAILFPVFFRARESHTRTPSGVCQSNLKMIALGFIQYTQDYDEKFPPVSSGGKTFGWADAVLPYTKSIQFFQCPAEKGAVQLKPQEVGYTDYFYNARLLSVSRASLEEPTPLVMTGEGNDGTDFSNARYSVSSLPLAWVEDANSPAHRHLDGANYGFADGHVKWLRPELNSWTQSGFGFEPKKVLP